MRRFIASLTIIGALLPTLASAKDTMMLGRVLVPSGFCKVAEDGTRGIRFDGQGYKSWISMYALDRSIVDDLVRKWNLNRQKEGLPVMNEMEEASYRVSVQATPAKLWYGEVSKGQNSLCPVK